MQQAYSEMDVDGGGLSSTLAPGGDECGADDELCGPATNPFELSAPLQTLYTAAFAAIVLLAALDNSAVVWIVLSVRTMRNSINLFLVNLSVADFSMRCAVLQFSVLVAAVFCSFIGSTRPAVCSTLLHCNGTQ